MELITEAKMVIVYETCPKCETGLMERAYNQPVLSSYPKQYPHKCNECGFVTYYTSVYPYHKLIPIEPLRKAKDDEK